VLDAKGSRAVVVDQQARGDRRAKKAGLQRRPPPNRGPYVASVTDLMTGNANAYTPGGPLELRGSRLKFDAARPNRSQRSSPMTRCWGRPDRIQEMVDSPYGASHLARMNVE